ncbi:28S ribosomal protein S34-like protein [Dinothrombium tinctorium]|uniref:28S ribosomal protein S34-like protein n=1 Tax=Dinothrombium tinctorium TaxID=1965070 RepID=A0A3S3RV81_9ACAR|nr:28S ribosomal protein S34-like protein [Dinothrombium tinctorium]RWS05219.1 28S ribosomal protein S34-like protein [Dinothrombium tinctorium]
MPKIIEIGKKNALCGKRVFEILANLKDFGRGRYLVRNTFLKQYPSKTYFKVIEAWPQMDADLANGRCFVEQVFNGKRVPGITEICTYHPDYALIPKEDEADFIIENPPVWGESDVQLLPKYIKVPPVMAEFLNRKKLNIRPNITLKGLSKERHGYDAKSLIEFRIPAVYDQSKFLFQYKYRIADEDNGEKPDIDYDKHPLYCERLLQGIEMVETVK